MRNIQLAILLFVIIGFALYANTFGNDFLFDDYPQIVENHYVKDFDVGKIFTTSIAEGYGGQRDSFYRPLVTLSFAVDYKLWRDNPAGYHFINILLHVLSAILVYLIFLSLQPNKTVSFLTSLLFIIHPLQVESVTYISGRTDLMPIFFMLLSLFLFIPVFYKNDKKHIFFMSSLISFILALLSKELSIIFPILLAIVYFVFIEKGFNRGNIKKGFLYILPFIVLAGGYVLLRLNWLPFTGAYSFHQDIWGRILSFLKVLMIYWGVLIFPYNLRSRFDKEFSLSIYSSEVIISLVILVVILYFSIKSLQKEKKILFGVSWFFVCLAPASGILIPLFSIVAERWLRMPSIGLFYLFSLGTVWFLKNFKNNIFIKNAILGSLIIYLIFLSITTVITNSRWKDTLSYFSYLRKYYPKESVIHANLAVAYDEAGDEENALTAFKKAVEFNSQFPAYYDNLGNYYYNHGSPDLAIEQYKKALEINKDFVRPYQPLAQLYINNKQYDEAIVYLEQLRDLLPDSWKVYSLLGQAYILKGDYVKARENIEKSLSLNADNEKLKQLLNSISIK